MYYRESEYKVFTMKTEHIKSKRFYFFLAIAGCLIWSSCREIETPVTKIDAAKVLHENQDQLTQLIIFDVFTPPVAARIYSYTSLASYEAIRFAIPGNESLAEKMNGFKKMPVPEKGEAYDFTLAASTAFFTVAHKVVFSLDSLKKYEDHIFSNFKAAIPDTMVYSRSVAFGKKVADAILSRANDDSYTKTRGKAKFLGSNEPGKWRPTQPDYMDGVEWCWNEIDAFLLDSASQFLAPPPPVYSTDTNSVFFKMVKEVYDINKGLTDEQKTIARFWDDNPFVMEHSGHLMFANKKITPGGHWMGIAAIAAQQVKADQVKVARTYALTAVALFDAFISCWDAKYRWNYVRPVTVINEYIEKTWSPLLQTPPFPEYSSGHSTITASAATVLTKLYGENFAFLDTSDLRYIGMKRNFTSFKQAAEECSISRVYGGIHYRLTVDRSAILGQKIGELIIRKLAL
jgi:PAP2 superfamily